MARRIFNLSLKNKEIHMMKKRLIVGLLMGCGIAYADTATQTTPANGKIKVPAVNVGNYIGTSPQIGPATETLTINGTQVKQFSSALVRGPIASATPVTITYGGNYPCQKPSCTVSLQLPSSCYATKGTVNVYGNMTYNVQQGYFVEGLYCSPYEKSHHPMVQKTLNK